MSYYKRDAKKRKNRFHLLLWASIILAGVCILWVAFRYIFRSTALHQPVLSGGTVVNMLTSKRTLVRRINELQTTLESYDVEVLRAKMLEQENNELKTELGRVPKPQGTLAHVLTLPNRSFYDTFIIDAGSAEGIMEGSTVYAFGAVALGTISVVNNHQSTVLLFSKPGRETAGTTVGSDVAIILIGRGAGEYEVRIPRDVRFEEGGLIGYQSVDTAVLARIEKIITDPRDPFQRILAKAPTNLQALKWVIVR